MKTSAEQLEILNSLTYLNLSSFLNRCLIVQISGRYARLGRGFKGSPDQWLCGRYPVPSQGIVITTVNFHIQKTQPRTRDSSQDDLDRPSSALFENLLLIRTRV